MDIPEKLSKNFYPSAIWAIGNLLSLLISLGSVIIVFTRMQDASRQIPSILITDRELALNVAVLQDQQRNLDGKYAEIMLQLSRLDAKLDKQNDYLFDSLQHLDGKQKNSYRPRNFLIPGISPKISTIGVGNTAPPQ